MDRELNIAEIRIELHRARQQVISNMGLRDQARVEQVADAMDQVQAAEAREFAVLNLDRYARQLREIEHALQRIDTGGYGVCVDCEEEIDPKRLRALPWASRCVRCQELADQVGTVSDAVEFEALPPTSPDASGMSHEENEDYSRGRKGAPTDVRCALKKTARLYITTAHNGCAPCKRSRGDGSSRKRNARRIC